VSIGIGHRRKAWQKRKAEKTISFIAGGKPTQKLMEILLRVAEKRISQGIPAKIESRQTAGEIRRNALEQKTEGSNSRQNGTLFSMKVLCEDKHTRCWEPESLGRKHLEKKPWYKVWGRLRKEN